MKLPTDPKDIIAYLQPKLHCDALDRYRSCRTVGGMVRRLTADHALWLVRHAPELVTLPGVAARLARMAPQYGLTPLHVAARLGEADCARLLLAAGADPNPANHYGLTPLHVAASLGNAECVRLLLGAGADPYAANQYGRTPLHRAASLGNAECVRLLKEAQISREGETDE